MDIKKSAVFIIILLAILLPVSAELDVTKAYNYLSTKSINGSYNNNIIDTSLALLAFGSANNDVSKEISYLKSQENDQKCWPKQSCNVKDTAFAILALNSAGQNLEDEVLWLEKAQSAAQLSGTWYLEIATADTGTCKLSYESNNQTMEKEVSVVKGVFPACGNSTFFNINNCLAKGIISAMPSLELDVNCESLSSVDSITILFQTSNSFYLVDEEQASRANLMIKNGCFGAKYKSVCDIDSSLYANLALKTMQSSMDTVFYLRQNYDPANPLHNAILYIVAGDQAYSKELANRQRNDGSWNTNVYQTAFSVLALKSTEFTQNIENAKKYFEHKQLADGSLGNVQDTALTLYAAYSENSNLPECFSGDVTLCSKQTGACQGSYETCSNNTFAGCTDAIYSSFNSSYESEETTCDNLDNDCDGSIDTGCDCSAGIKRACAIQFGVCNGTIETCNIEGKWPGCDYSKVIGYQDSEKTCNDKKDNDCDDSIDLEDEDCIATSNICDNDGSCDETRGESNSNCPDDCTEQTTCNNGRRDDDEDGVDCGGVCDTSCEPAPSNECNDDSYCDADLGETSSNCPNDCPACGDGACDDSIGEDEETCPEDCTSDTTNPPPVDNNKPPTSTSIIWYILLILVLLAIVAYIVYKKKFKKQAKGKDIFGSLKTDSKPPIFQSMFTSKKDEKPFQQKLGNSPFQKTFGAAKKTDLENELEKSISEAKKIMGKEK